jgi:hypothetical protein
VYFEKAEDAMTDHDKHKLLEEILGDEELDQLRQGSLLRGLQEMRRRRQRVMISRVSMMALPVLLLVVVAFYPRVQPTHPALKPMAMAQTAEAASKVEYISKDQLFALFPNRPMALVGKPGHQQVIFLDDHPANVQQ